MNKVKNFRGVSFLISFFLLLTVGVFQKAEATHLRAGEIIVERVSCQALIFRITIRVYTDTGSEVRFGEGFLDFGDGSDPVVLPQIENTSRPDLGDEVATAEFTIEHTYASPGTYKIGYVEPNRNEGVLNIDNSVETTFYVETEINIDPFLGCNNSPKLLIPPIDRGCPGVAFFHNPGAFDPDGDSLSYELVIPKKEIGTVVDGYEPVNDDIFYENPAQGNENGNGPPVFEIDPITGEVTWDAPGQIGEYNIAFIVKEWRKINGQYFELGFVTRDMQIIIEDCDNERPELDIPEDICVEAGTTIDEIIRGSDPDGDDVKIEAFSQVFDLGAEKDPVNEGVFQSTNPDSATYRFRWVTTCDNIREQPYQVVFKITDRPAEGPKLVSFATWNITIVGPSPDVTTLDQEGQGLRLNWDNYTCEDEAESMQIWRRVDSNPYTPDECETGMRENAGYSLLTTVAPTVTTYKDTNVAAAAKYCYRLVAVFPDPEGGESIVSEEICHEFIPAEEPIITHVSVEVTDEDNGEVEIAWREPFELGTLVPPYTFRVYRSEGFTNESNGVMVSEQVITSSEITAGLDSADLRFRDTGLNTLNKVYNYKVAIVDPSGAGGDEEIFGASASTVRLEPTPLAKKIQIDWSAVVPWSNSIATPPGSEHLIYRGLEGTAEEDLQFLAKVDVIANGFTYIDSIDIDDEKVYCYKVLTKGTYGNPDIESPQFNFSQMVCAQPSDSIPPCQPVVSIEGPGCESLARDLCESPNQIFRNTITWSTEFIGECQDDVRKYELYFAEQVGGTFELLATVQDTFYLHQKTDSYKGCYRVKAIDRSGNESEFSETFCVDNCPNYELPNVFTPGDNNSCNDTFKAFGAPNSGCEFSSESFRDNSERCARFVESVTFTVYNRWGQPIYTYRGEKGTENDIFINWNGRDDSGAEVAAGVYYYLAEVVFDVVNPAESKKNIKGWVQVLR
ncbi:gliding motility-associated C-terminal domain-containing protein [Fulvivirga sp. RKSG066]|uniref:T9SS type B sorting domain-containing protein n=1 Tax=Fulvivirga aurantia TaxID=2529383 RepID=UPI0012BC29BA|nr:gliding motility-associated C-terminal domain-containing protein [Fulvivirga aurantia]MTI22170.1 gliding motility-associated C-terminal domain-containing protein [Fulvivirga aurantia]